MKDLTHCVLCGSKHVVIKPTKLSRFVNDRMQGIDCRDPNTALIDLDHWAVICENCGFKHSSRRYTVEQEARYYHDYGTGSYLDQRCHYEGDALRHVFGQNQPAILPQRRAELAQVFARVPELKPRSVIDWGGLGRSINRDFGNCVYYYTDISGSLPESGWINHQGESADLICSQQVLEHVSDPRTLIGTMIDHLNPGGYLYIEVPNEDQFYAAVMIHEHINGWSPLSLTWAMLEFDLTVVLSESNSVNHWILARKPH